MAPWATGQIMRPEVCDLLPRTKRSLMLEVLHQHSQALPAVSRYQLIAATGAVLLCLSCTTGQPPGSPTCENAESRLQSCLGEAVAVGATCSQSFVDAIMASDCEVLTLAWNAGPDHRVDGLTSAEDVLSCVPGFPCPDGHGRVAVDVRRDDLCGWVRVNQGGVPVDSFFVTRPRTALSRVIEAGDYTVDFVDRAGLVIDSRPVTLAPENTTVELELTLVLFELTDASACGYLGLSATAVGQDSFAPHVVTRVADGSPAANVGIEVGDVILSAQSGETVFPLVGLHDYLAELGPQADVDLTLQKENGAETSVRVELGRR